MTYNFNKQQHSTKIKEGLERAKKNGKKLGRPSGKIKGEDLVMDLYSGKIKCYVDHSEEIEWKPSINNIACIAMVSESTVKRIIKKHKTNGKP